MLGNCVGSIFGSSDRDLSYDRRCGRPGDDDGLSSNSLRLRDRA